MTKYFEKFLYETLNDIVAKADLTDTSVDLRAMQAQIRLTRENSKAHDLIRTKLTDDQYERLRVFFESAANNLKAICEEIKSSKETPKTEKAEDKEKPKFYVGQRVQFKTWEEMEDEFGLDEDEDIAIIGYGFIRDMQPLCATFATIESLNGETVKLKDFSLKQTGNYYWKYSLKMLKPAE